MLNNLLDANLWSGVLWGNVKVEEICETDEGIKNNPEDCIISARETGSGKAILKEVAKGVLANDVKPCFTHYAFHHDYWTKAMGRLNVYHCLVHEHCDACRIKQACYGDGAVTFGMCNI